MALSVSITGQGVSVITSSGTFSFNGVTVAVEPNGVMVKTATASMTLTSGTIVIEGLTIVVGQVPSGGSVPVETVEQVPSGGGVPVATVKQVPSGGGVPVATVAEWQLNKAFGRISMAKGKIMDQVQSTTGLWGSVPVAMTKELGQEVQAIMNKCDAELASVGMIVLQDADVKKFYDEMQAVGNKFIARCTL